MTTDLISALRNAQLPDGGWAYRGTSSWTEPTAMALIALQCHGVEDERVRRGIQWLRRLQRPDGGWRPQPSVDQSTWVTALALLVRGLEPAAVSRGLEWLMNITGRESWKTERLRNFLMGVKPAVSDEHAGWPWFPDTAGWVTPTCASIFALRAAVRHTPANSRYTERIAAGTKFLMARRCPDGGWNHGSSRALGYDLMSYPETTGQALVALQGVQWEGIQSALNCAEQHLKRAASVESVAWLRLGLAVHGHHLSRGFPPAHSALDTALELIVEASEKGIHAFALRS